jgi:hypothetical protein
MPPPPAQARPESQVPPQQGCPSAPQAAHDAPPSPACWQERFEPHAVPPPPVQHSPPGPPHAEHVAPEQRAPEAVHVALKLPAPPSAAPQHCWPTPPQTSVPFWHEPPLQVPASPAPMQAEPEAVHMPRMQQPPELQAFAPQQTWPAAPHGVPLGVVVGDDPPHEERTSSNAAAAIAKGHRFVEANIDRLPLEGPSTLHVCGRPT